MTKYNIILFVLVSIIFSCSNNTEHNAHDGHKLKVYTCPMHPQIIRNEPGQCPICGMKLVEKLEDGKATENSELLFLLKPTNEYVFSEVHTIVPKHLEYPLEITTAGIINYDTRKIAVVSARISGWIEKLYVKYKFQSINAGDKLMDVYSKELLTEQENFIYLLNKDSENMSLIQSVEKRLLLLGLNIEQVERLKQNKQPIHSVTFYSQYSGHLHDINDAVDFPINNNMQMDGNLNNELIIKEGVYVKKGQGVFNIYNSEKVYAKLDISNENIQQLKFDMPVKISVNSNELFEINGKIDFIEPTYTNNKKVSAARVYLDNSNQKLKVGQLVNAKINLGMNNGLFVSTTSVVHLGKTDIVFIKENNVFKSKAIVIGKQMNELTEVISGISEKDIIAENAQMLIDSESFIKINQND